MTKRPTNQPTNQTKNKRKIPQTNQNLKTTQKDPPKAKPQKQVEILNQCLCTWDNRQTGQ